MENLTMSLTTTINPALTRIYVPPQYTNQLESRIVGGYVMIVAIIGLCLNVFMFFHFLKSEKLSFYILCTSKTLSNSMSLLGYLCYIGPVHLFYTSIGSEYLSSRLVLIFGLALILHSPMTEMLITANRFLVVMFTPVSVPKYSNHVTLVALAAIWLVSIWWSVLPGYPDYCFVPYGFIHVGTYKSECNQGLVLINAITILVLAVFNNTMNILLGIKLALSAKKLKTISSVAARNRQKQTTRFFVQSMIQDWLTASVVLNNMAAEWFYCTTRVCSLFSMFATDVLVYATDGYVMFFFNYKSIKKSANKNTSIMGTTVDEASTKVFTTRADVVN